MKIQNTSSHSKLEESVFGITQGQRCKANEERRVNSVECMADDFSSSRLVVTRDSNSENESS